MKLLSLEQKEFYKENGYVKLGNILSTDESDRISDEYSDLFLVSFIEKLMSGSSHIFVFWFLVDSLNFIQMKYESVE